MMKTLSRTFARYGGWAIFALPLLLIALPFQLVSCLIRLALGALLRVASPVTRLSLFERFGRGLRSAIAKLQQSRVFRTIARVLTMSFEMPHRPASPPATDLLRRERTTRGVLICLVGAEWLCVLIAGMMLGLQCLCGFAPGAIGRFIPTMAIFSAIAIVLLIAIPSAYRQRLIRRWRSLEFAVCGTCGYVRDYLPTRRCPECGSQSAPVPPGALPVAWQRWAPVVGERGMVFPVAVVGASTPVLAWMSQWASEKLVGIVILWLTAAVLGMAVLTIRDVADDRGRPDRS